MKKQYFLSFLTVLFGLYLSSLDISAQRCTQLNLPEHAITRLCIPRDKHPADLDFSPDGQTLASLIYCCPREIILWDIKNKIEKLTIIVTNDNYHSIRFSPDGKTFVCGNTLYDTTTGQPKLILSDSEGYENRVIYSPDGKTLVGAGSKGLRFWNSTADPTTDTSPIGILPTDTSVIDTPKDGFVATPIATSSVTVPGIRGLSYSPDGKELAIACDLGIWIYNAELNSEKILLTKEIGGHSGGDVNSTDYSSDGNFLVSCTTRDDVRLWDIKAKKHMFTLSLPKIPNGSLYGLSNSVSFLPESNIFFIGTASGIHFYNALNGEYKYTLLGHGSFIHSMDYSPNSNTIASAANDKTIILWDLTSYPIVSISPDSVASLTAGEELTFDLKITNGKNISGYQATIEFDPNVLASQKTEYGDYLSDELPIQPIVNNHSGRIQLASLSSSGINSNGDGNLATLKFKVNAIINSELALRDVLLSDNEGNQSYAWIEGTLLLNSAIAEGCATFNIKDVNKDCVINIQDLVLVATNFGRGGENVADVNGDGTVNIIDLVLVAGAFGDTAAAPAVYADTQEMLSASNVQHWLREAHKVNLTDSTFQRGMLMLEQLLIVLTPTDTALLPNYPNPFNPETWIPYQLEKSAEVTISIYSADGVLIRTLPLGYQPAGIYRSRDRAAYWDGTNEVGESVASGVYFYTLSAGEFKATRKMLVVK